MIHYADLGAVAYVNGHPHWSNRAVPVTYRKRRGVTA